MPSFIPIWGHGATRDGRASPGCPQTLSHSQKSPGNYWYGSEFGCRSQQLGILTGGTLDHREATVGDDAHLTSQTERLDHQNTQGRTGSRSLLV